MQEKKKRAKKKKKKKKGKKPDIYRGIKSLEKIKQSVIFPHKIQSTIKKLN